MRSMMNAMPDEENRNSYGDGVALLDAPVGALHSCVFILPKLELRL